MNCQGAPTGVIGLTDLWNRDGALAADLADGNRFYLFKSDVLYASLDGGTT